MLQGLSRIDVSLAVTLAACQATIQRDADDVSVSAGKRLTELSHNGVVNGVRTHGLVLQCNSFSAVYLVLSLGDIANVRRKHHMVKQCQWVWRWQANASGGVILWSSSTRSHDHYAAGTALTARTRSS